MEATSLLMGLAAGFAATAAMMLIEVPVWKMSGLRAVMEWQENQAIAGRLLGMPGEDMISRGLLFHFLHGGLAGMIFVVGVEFMTLGLPLLSLGLLYGFLLWLVGLAIYRLIVGQPMTLDGIGRIAVFINLMGHIAYGLVLGVLVGVA